MNREQAIEEMLHLLDTTNLTFNALGHFYESYPEGFVNNTIQEYSTDINVWNRLWAMMNTILGVGDSGATPQTQNKEDTGGTYGEGIFTRDPGVLPPSVQKLLNKVGSETINKIVVWRKPISVNQALKNMGLKLPYDNIFHLAVNLNGKYNLQKNEYIKFTEGKPEGEKLEIPVGNSMTFDELFLKTKNRIGPENFTEYDAVLRNCQIMVSELLKTLGSFTPEADKFINQDPEKIFKALGGPFAKFITKLAVKASQVVNKIQEGGADDDIVGFAGTIGARPRLTGLIDDRQPTLSF